LQRIETGPPPFVVENKNAGAWPANAPGGAMETSRMQKALSGAGRTGLFVGIFAQIAITPIMAKI
jgi:hypothetical protein